VGKIDYGRILIGGIVAGLIFLGFDVLGFMLMNMDMDAWLAQHSLHQPPMWVFYVTDILFGFLAVWLYAVIRPRFGPGWKTAGIAALFMWLCFSLAYFSFHMMGLFTQGDYMMMAGWWLVGVFVATLVGAFLYREGDTAPRV
jgi:multisubunit Na+/H+ antiporter MnhB subunit